MRIFISTNTEIIFLIVNYLIQSHYDLKKHEFKVNAIKIVISKSGQKIMSYEVKVLG